jgi:hypothetical protein
MWNDDDFQSAIDYLYAIMYKEELEDFIRILKEICTGEDKIKLWGKLPPMQQEILRNPEYLPSFADDIDHGVAA